MTNVEIISIQLVKEPAQVYNIEVGRNHTFIANGIIVHNKVVSGEGDNFTML